MAQCDESYGFIVEWFDTQAELVRRYRLTYFVKRGTTNEIELFDIKNKRVFLKRVALPALTLADLYIGATLSVYARQLKVVEFCDNYTKEKCGKATSFLVLIVNANKSPYLGHAVSDIENAKDLRICQMRMLRVSAADAQTFGRQLQLDISSVQSISERPVLALELMHNQGAAFWNSFSAAFKNKYRVQSFALSNPLAVEMLLGNEPLTSAARPTATFSQCTCCVIKPHAVKSKYAGNILTDILADSAGWEITALKLVQLDMAAASEFLEVYKGVTSTFHDHATELCSGLSIAMELRAPAGTDSVGAFRMLAGPFQWDFAKKLRPKSLRAKYGIDTVHCGVHCTDLPDDGPSESEYFFDLL